MIYLANELNRTHLKKHFSDELQLGDIYCFFNTALLCNWQQFMSFYVNLKAKISYILSTYVYYLFSLLPIFKISN